MKVKLPDPSLLKREYPTFSITTNDEGNVKIVCDNKRIPKMLLHHLTGKLVDLNPHLYIRGPFKEKVVNGKLETTFFFKEKKTSSKKK